MVANIVVITDASVVGWISASGFIAYDIGPDGRTPFYSEVDVYFGHGPHVAEVKSILMAMKFIDLFEFKNAIVISDFFDAVYRTNTRKNLKDCQGYQKIILGLARKHSVDLVSGYRDSVEPIHEVLHDRAVAMAREFPCLA